MERLLGDRAASETGRAIVSGASSMLDWLRRSRRPLLVARGAAVEASSVASGPSKSARDERQLLRGRPPTSPPSPNRPPSIPYRQPQPQRWIPRAQRFEGRTVLYLYRVLRLPRDRCTRQRPLQKLELKLVPYRTLVRLTRRCADFATKAARPDQLHTAGTRTGPHLAPRADGAASSRHRHARQAPCPETN